MLSPRKSVLRLYSTGGVYSDIPEVRSVRFSDTHRVCLHNNGQISADGSPGQHLSVRAATEIKSAEAIPNCTLLVSNGGTLIRRGIYPFPEATLSWTDLRAVYATAELLVAIRNDGSVLSADRTAPRPALSASRLGGKAVSAAVCGGDAYILLENGRVYDVVNDAPLREEGVVAAAAENGALLLLGQDGSVRTAAGRTDPVASEVCAWRNVVLLAAGSGCVAAVDGDGRLHLAGETRRLNALRDADLQLGDFLLS